MLTYKPLLLFFLFAVSLLLVLDVNSQSTSGNVGIGTTTPNAGAVLDITSSDKALIIPRLSTSAIEAIPSPTEGMIAFDLDKRALVTYARLPGTAAISQKESNQRATHTGSFTVGQSFTAVSTVQLESIDAPIFATGPASYTMTLYEGDGLSGGAVLGSVSQTVKQRGTTAAFSFRSQGIVLQAGKVYTFYTRNYQTAVTIQSIAYFSSANNYSGGQMYSNGGANPTYDLVFEVNQVGAGQWQQPITPLSNQPIIVSSIVQDTVQAPALLNNWVNYGYEYAPAGFYKDKEGVVRLRGLIKGGTFTSQTVLFTLPEGYRPTSGRLIFNVENGGTTLARVDVLANGNVVLVTASGNTYLNFTGISFRAD